ncbi:MAG: hypothetical protein Gaeavirus25_9 [Gaeavirus sp.]|uniref:C2H2-type domain-containing protein n=1 Tax=Gaeavirus sp. TaxID=2487767 RepID=A0A3G4ZZJ8_9VIRU|nr:MAG: hypothetical protein Gaeavirus25_9 [Gaeavirus sp.]
MVSYTCPNCKKVFTKKSNYEYHVKQRKKSCMSKKVVHSTSNIKSSDNEEVLLDGKNNSSETEEVIFDMSNNASDDKKIKLDMNNNSSNNEEVRLKNTNELSLDDIENFMDDSLTDNIDNKTCMYCKSTFTRTDNLLRHQQNNCRSKKYHDGFKLMQDRI